MIHKIIKGAYFKGALQYVLDPAKGMLIGGTFGSHQSAGQIAQEMREVAGDRLQKPVFHAVLSLRPGEALSVDQWNDAARRYLAALGFNDTPYVLVRHNNREHDHVHIVASRVRYDGSVVSDRQDRFKGLAAVRELSREYGLAMGPRRGAAVLPEELRTLIRRAAGGQPTFATFLARLEASGVRVTTYLSARSQKVQGLAFHLDGATFKGSQLGRELTWNGLQKSLGVRYEPATDLPALLARSSRQPDRADHSAWSPATLGDLSNRLRTLRTGTRAGEVASRDLLRKGSEAFRVTAHVARFLEGTHRLADASRQIARALAPGEHLSLALSFLGAVRSPGTAALFLLRLSARSIKGARSAAPAAADPALLFLRQVVQAAAGDRPVFAVFRDRLAEAGVHLGPGSFVLPDRIVPARAIGLDARQLERLGVQNAADRFGDPDRPVRGGDRDRRGHRGDPSGGGSPVEPGLRPDGGARTAPDSAPGAARRAGEALAGSDRGAHFGSGPPAPQPQAPGRPDLGHRGGARSEYLPPAGGYPHSSATRLVPDGAAPGPAPDRTAARSAHPSAPGGSPAGPFVPSPGSPLPRELALQLQALGEEGVELRARSTHRTVTRRMEDSRALDRRLPALIEEARRGATLEIRALDPRVQHLPGVTAEVLERARQQGAEPALVVQRGDGAFDVWLRHSPTASPQTLPYLSRALRAEYGQTPLGAARPFGPLAGLDPAVRLIEAPGAPYARAQALADYFAVSRRSLDEQLAARLRSAGVSPLAQYRAANPGPAADREWSRFALRQGLQPRDVAQELLRSGARSQAGPRAQALHASRVLASTLPGTSARDVPKVLLSTASQVLGVSLNALSMVRTVLTQAVHRTLGRI